MVGLKPPRKARDVLEQTLGPFGHTCSRFFNLWAAFLALFMCVLAAGPVSALGLFDARTIQEALVWSGLYAGPIDGQLGEGSAAAIRAFQQSIGRQANGILNSDELSILLAQGGRKQRTSGYTFLVDDFTGAGMGFPLGLAPNRTDAEYGSDYFSADRSLLIGLRHYNLHLDIKSAYDGLMAALSSTEITYSVQRPSWFVIGGVGKSKNFYFRFFSSPSGYDGMFALYDPARSNDFTPAITMLSLTFRPQLKPPSLKAQNAPEVQNLPIDPSISSELLGVVSVGTLPIATPYSSSTHDANQEEQSKLLLDSIERLIADKAANGAKFFKYIVPKAELSGFNNDMPVLRVVFGERVFFDTNKAEIRSEASSVIDEVATTLRSQSGRLALFVAGHTDSRGTEQHNLDLSIRRADSVARALVAKGVGPALIWRVGFGKAVPLLPNSTPQNMAHNRRVEFLLATQPTVIAAWVKNTKTLCESRDGLCGQDSSRSMFDAVPVGREDVKISLQLPPRLTLVHANSRPTSRPPLPHIILTRPSLEELAPPRE